MYRLIIIIAFFLPISLYFGTGGFLILENELRYKEASDKETKAVGYLGGTFKNKEVLEVAKQQNLIKCAYPYISQIPSFLSFIITAICFGMIGSISKVLNDTVKEKIEIQKEKNLLLIPLLGGLIGLIILGISYAIPTILISDEVSLTPISVVILSLLGGIFYLDFFKWIEGKFKLFTKNDTKY